MIMAPEIPVIGMSPAIAEISAIEAAAAAPESPNHFVRLVNLYQSNDRLQKNLRSISLNVVRVREYLASVGSNPNLGNAQILRLRNRRSAVLTLLRANRLEARALLNVQDSTAIPA